MNRFHFLRLLSRYDHFSVCCPYFTSFFVLNLLATFSEPALAVRDVLTSLRPVSPRSLEIFRVAFLFVCQITLTDLDDRLPAWQAMETNMFCTLPYGERGIWTLAPLLTTYSLSRGAPSASLGTSPNCPRFVVSQKRLSSHSRVFI